MKCDTGKWSLKNEWKEQAKEIFGLINGKSVQALRLEFIESFTC